ncbi:MAG: hypothetical protein F4232_04625, partial [Acidimicrobiaceae bacterium]|nr:hypothetical protein [Acidimicrobiaceae bacterium]
MVGVANCPQFQLSRHVSHPTPCSLAVVRLWLVIPAPIPRHGRGRAGSMHKHATQGRSVKPVEAMTPTVVHRCDGAWNHLWTSGAAVVSGVVAQPLFRAPVGTRDILPPESARRRRLVAVFADLAERTGFGLLESPVFEELGVFQRLGADNDVVTKELFEFFDKGDPP